MMLKDSVTVAFHKYAIDVSTGPREGEGQTILGFISFVS